MLFLFTRKHVMLRIYFLTITYRHPSASRNSLIVATWTLLIASITKKSKSWRNLPRECRPALSEGRGRTPGNGGCFVLFTRVRTPRGMTGCGVLSLFFVLFKDILKFWLTVLRRRDAAKSRMKADVIDRSASKINAIRIRKGSSLLVVALRK